MPPFPRMPVEFASALLNAGPAGRDGGSVEVRLITADAVERRSPDELEMLLDGPGLVWVDVRYWDAETASFLEKRLGLHPRAVRDCAVRNPVPKVHTYPDQTFLVLHAPEQGAGGHVHYIELDQFVGPNWVLTVHGPMNPVVELDAAYVETTTVARRLDRGRLRPTRGCELSAALVDVLIARLTGFLTTLTENVWALEQQVTGGLVGDPEQFLEQLFAVRHGLLAVQTMAASSREVYGRMVRLSVFGEGGAARLVDLEDQLRRVAAMADGQREYLQGVIEFYQTRTGTKMAIAAERLAVIAAVTLPITALTSILGMNVIVYDRTQVGQLVVLLALMAVMSGILLVWTHRKGWW
jgi:Mg2+ and Co2+ transporter CorA